MPSTGDLLDRIDDELFATDYRLSSQRHLTLLPEPPTLRLATAVRAVIADSPRMRLRLERTGPPPDTPTVRLPRRPPEPAAAPLAAHYVPVAGASWSARTSPSGWPSVVYRPAPRRAGEPGTQVVAVIGLAVLIIVAVAGAGIVIVWWG